MAINVTGILRNPINGVLYENPKILITPILSYRGDLDFNATVVVNDIELNNFGVSYDKTLLLIEEINPYDSLIYQGHNVIIDYLKTIVGNENLIYEID